MTARRLLSILAIVASALLGMAPAAAAQTVGPFDSERVSVADLLADPEAYTAMEVEVWGELVGDFGRRDDRQILLGVKRRKVHFSCAPAFMAKRAARYLAVGGDVADQRRHRNPDVGRGVVDAGRVRERAGRGDRLKSLNLRKGVCER